MINYMSEVANILGVEMNKDFECKENDYMYRLTERGCTCNGCYGADSLMMFLCGELTIRRKPWMPKVDEYYWVVKPDGEMMYIRWYGGATDMTFYKLGNCYRLKAAAESDRKKWMDFYASGEVLDIQ
jgi:hypothetical protein